MRNGWPPVGRDRAFHVAAVVGWAVLVLHQVVGSLRMPLRDALFGFEPAYALGDRNRGPASLGLDVLVHGVLWLAMIAATMLPSIGENVRFVALRCPRRLRRAAAVDVVGGWIAAWSVAALLIGGAAWSLVRGLGQLPAVAVAFVAAAAWQLTARKRISMARCHRTLAPPVERRAARAACRSFGFGLGVECGLRCWALMLPMAVLHHRLLAVVPLAAVSWYERGRPHALLRQRTTASVVAAIGLGTVGALAVA